MEKNIITKIDLHILNRDWRAATQYISNSMLVSYPEYNRGYNLWREGWMKQFSVSEQI